jgi:hypothetical protein
MISLIAFGAWAADEPGVETHEVGVETAEPDTTRPAPDWVRTEEREPCAAYEPLRRPFFGDTHIHTTYSQDASTQGTRTTPDQAYAFAKGAPLTIHPWLEDGSGERTVQLDRPLDFTALTDHAEQIGEVHICKTPGTPGHDSWVCRLYRGWPRAAFFVMNAGYSWDSDRWGFCGENDEHCLEAAGVVWRDIQAAAEGAYDRSEACRFTSFVAYEWTAADRPAKNLHRNVIFRNDNVPALPVSVMETGNTAFDLWTRLRSDCVEGTPGCEVLTIPHNSNLDGGLMFQSAREHGAPLGTEEASIRSRWEPLVEIMQHKGDSECLLGGETTDEACGFEKFPFGDIGSASGAAFGTSEDPVASQFVREALKMGLAIEREHGANPFRYGIIASTDTHLGTPGLVSERSFPGHGGAGIPLEAGAVPPIADRANFNPGGLAVVWAEENSRDALFSGMQRREVYGTSGTRPEVRFFGGAALPADLCSEPDWVGQAYDHGVPMGGTLSESDAAPRFVVSALRDPSNEASPLQRIQIVKGWLDAEGRTHERVVDVAGGANDATVDLATCAQHGEGHAQLCTEWSDPDWDPSQPAFYYARVLENPSCRWTQWICAEHRVDCADPSTIGPGLEACCAEDHRPILQERAWTSPIWTATSASQ